MRNICNYLIAPDGKVKISNNALGCNSAAEVLAKCPTSGFTNFSSTSIKVYPNPSNEGIFIHFDTPVSGRIVVTDMQGNTGQYIADLIDQQKVSNDVSKWCAGLSIIVHQKDIILDTQSLWFGNVCGL